MGVLTRLEHRWRCIRKIDQVQIEHPPVFILGHWRSGTTWLHELLSADSQLGYVSMWHALAPESIHVGWWIRYFFGWAVPHTRPMDNIALTMDAPFEEECAMAVLNDISYYHAFYFPRHARHHFDRAVMLEGLTDDERNAWRSEYVRFIKSVTKARQGKPLVLKNPANTARIAELAKLFPGARFVYIQRNPFDVYASMLRMRRRMVERVGLQCASMADIEQQILDQYNRVMQRYFDTRHLIPTEKLIELRYEDLERDPLGELRSIYETLQIGNFNAAEPVISHHLEARRNYQKNDHRLDDTVIARVREHWGWALDRLGYSREPLTT